MLKAAPESLRGVLAKGRLEEAEQLMIEALVITEKTLGADHPTVGIRLSNMAQLLIVKVVLQACSLLL